MRPIVRVLAKERRKRRFAELPEVDASPSFTWAIIRDTGKKGESRVGTEASGKKP